MFRSQQRKTKILFGLSDVVLAAAAFELAYRFREHLALDKTFFLLPDFKTLLICFSAITSVAIGYWLNVYGKVDSAELTVILRDGVRQVAYSAIAVVLFIVFGLQEKISRVFLASFFATNWVLLTIFRIAARNLIQGVSQSLGNQRHVLIVGLGESAERLGRNLENYRQYGLKILGFLNPDDTPGEAIQLADNYPVLPLSELRNLLNRHVVDEIHFAVESNRLPGLEEVFLLCDEEGVCSRLAVDFFPHVNSELALERIGQTPMLTFTAAPDDEVLLLAKRVIDIALSVVGMILLSPVLASVAILVKLTSRGPVIFSQQRCGLNGRTFTFYKFRSMVDGAEQRFHEVAHLSQREVATKIPNDPRLSPIGGVLRKFSLDELPQLFNVLKGDMSLVGPRPAIPGEVAQYKRWQRRRLRMRPGLTCLWAVEGRDHVDFETWMRMDLQYIDNWSLSLDARIILLTIPHVLSGKGAN